MTRLITKDGLKKLQGEFEERKTKVRQEIAQAIKEAKEQGDLSENAEYSEAKRQQAENETRIAQLEVMIKNSEVVERNGNSDCVEIGSFVKVKFNGSEMEFQLVGSNETDPANMKISNESPMGKSFMGKCKGENVSVETPGGKVKYEILEVK
ncbi:MAG: Transcription elongation factor GreA [Candidatus Moranbacteria bacterium GW2011_GWE2_35_2-]|nr:MAG: Transcription elongation factor GreA [Candidatus Moranbacteria bacterium GW2011_GWE2_35_2-]KKQ06042.1 MAG: Transcription elongation factor GreA [Candidatus Moranbacteria bacterium GW2011_GWF1_36_4]KKQ22979.1 MAG: Transcription elongation factor GreA [Candidatus Moranbacteria bacterium GW2011_GWF2_37_11]KKQ29337.1 MAG: Transcription elongation factor GreA [Candidatus Moranbacteria bacterium GW2011_GWD1_37_17]KKQ30790.1 MAG: Transcription elongation factor GreA [Candidatus Moranbacteria b